MTVHIISSNNNWWLNWAYLVAKPSPYESWWATANIYSAHAYVRQSPSTFNQHSSGLISICYPSRVLMWCWAFSGSNHRARSSRTTIPYAWNFSTMVVWSNSPATMSQLWACWLHHSFVVYLTNRGLAFIVTSQFFLTKLPMTPFRNLILPFKRFSPGSIFCFNNPMPYLQNMTPTITFTCYLIQIQSMCAHIVIHTNRSVKLNSKLSLCFRMASSNQAPAHFLLRYCWSKSMMVHGDFVLTIGLWTL